MHSLEPLSPERFLVWDLLRDTAGYFLNHQILLVDFSAVERLRDAWRAAGRRPPTYVACALHAVSRVLPRHPRFNSYLRAWPAPRLALYEGVDIALTVEKPSPDGEPRTALALLRRADRLELRDLADALGRLRASPLEGLPDYGTYRRFLRMPRALRMTLFRLLCKPSPARMREIGGTCAFTSVGREGVDFTTPLSPRSITFSLGRVAPRPFAVDGRAEVRPGAHITLTYDHRIADGAACARLGRDLKGFLERAFADPDRFPA